MRMAVLAVIVMALPVLVPVLRAGRIVHGIQHAR